MALYAGKLDAAQDDKQRAQFIKWGINHLICSSLPNFRIDLLGHSQAEFKKTGM